MFDWLGGAILNVLLKLIWYVFVQGPLNLIAIFNKVLEYLTGGITNDLLFGSSKEFKWTNIPIQFWWFIIVSLCIFALIFTIQMIILIFQEATETKTKFVLAIQNAVKAFAFMFLIPIFFFIANFIVQSLANTIINDFGKGDNIASYLWHIGDPKWNGTANGVPNDFSPPNDLRNYNMIAQIFGTWFMLFAIFIIGIILVQKIIELFFLFIISPIVMIVMVIDNGKAAFTWKDMVIAKFLASTGTLIGYYIFISVIQILLSTELTGLTTEYFGKTLFIILFLCGGGLATVGFCNLIAAFVGEGVGISEATSSFQSTIKGGLMALGATKIPLRAGKMIGKAVKTTKKSIKRNNEMKKSELNVNAFQSASKAMTARPGITGLSSGNIFNPQKNREIKINKDRLRNLNARISKYYEIKNNSQQSSIKKSSTSKKNLSTKEEYLIKLNKKLDKYQNRRSK